MAHVDGPSLADVEELHPGQVLWGWPHCVQDRAITQLAIDKSLTLIAWEAMNHWTPSGDFMVHVFHMNNEMAGYCSVLHALQLAGSSGDFGRKLHAVVIGFGGYPTLPPLYAATRRSVPWTASRCWPNGMTSRPAMRHPPCRRGRR